ncbi:MAG: hypothetical protein R3D02_02945 [Hyphomicrobiales bacterium]
MIESVVDTLSRRRFETYLRVGGHDVGRALALYAWNAELGAAFHVLLQAVEVAVRNRIATALAAVWGDEWWRHPQFVAVVDRDRTRDLDLVCVRLRRQNKQEETDQVIASLSFGFWVGMLDGRYNQHVWSRHLRSAFPGLPAEINRRKLHSTVQQVAWLRNRIFHHEPLLKIDAMQRYGDMMHLLRWICAGTADWIVPQCSVPAVVRRKP